MTVLAWRCLGALLLVAALAILHGTGLRVRMPADLAGWRWLVGIWLGAVAISGGALTATARVFGGNEATISATLQHWSQLWPVLPAAIFFVAGHIFWPVWTR